MDAVGAAASVLALVELAAKIGSKCVKYSVAVKHSKDDILRLQKEVQGLEQVLKKAQELYKSEDGIQAANTTTGQYLTKCKTQLEEILAKLEPSRVSRFGARFKLDRLTWPLRKKEVDELIENLENTKQSISLAMQVDQLATLKEMQINANLISLPIAEGASFDSFSDQLNTKCHAATRTALRQRIRDWFQDSNGTSIFWLSGMAGTGKSTILRSMADEFQKQDKLGATFFFKRGEGTRGNALRFFTTIANQLVQNAPELGIHITNACKADPNIYDKAMAEQFNRLIKIPITKLGEQAKHSPLLIVIDALDECDGEDDARLMIQLLAEIETSDSKVIRLLLSSRPEAPIRMTFGKLPDTKYISCTLHELSDDIRQDLKIYLKDELSTIQKNSEYELSDTWPTDQQISMLVMIAEPLFIAAATICRFIGDTRWDPEGQLDRILSYKNANHFERLGLVYQPVLDQLLVDLSKSQRQEMLADFHCVVGTIVVLEDALSRVALAALLGMSPKFVASRLSMLHSVLRIPKQEDFPIRLLHLSFRDFLTGDAQKDSLFWVNQCDLHQKTASACLQLLTMTPCLKQDICDLRKPAFNRTSIGEELILARIKPEIRYACRYWINHIRDSKDQYADHQLVYDFLKTRFLYWVEALVLLGHSSDIKGMLESLQEYYQNIDNLELNDFLRDAIVFMLTTRNLLDMFPLQLYSSGLTFTPKESIIRKTFGQQIPLWVKDLPIALDIHDESSPIHVGHKGRIFCAVLSSDNKQLATGGSDTSIKLWTTATSSLVHTLQGHESWVTFLAYTKQDARLISHARHGDKIIIWNTEIGCMERTIECGSMVEKVDLSPNGQLLAVSSVVTTHNDYGTTRKFELWDLTTYRKKDSQPIVKALTGPAAFMKFSADNKMLALAYDKVHKVKVVATSNGAQVAEFKVAHLSSTQDCECLAFSPQNDILAVMGFTGELQVWSLSDAQLRCQFNGPWGANLKFFPDGSRLVCAGEDDKVQVWNCIENCLDVQFLDCKLPVALSSNGSRLAMASEDGCTKIWDTSRTVPEQNLKLSPDHLLFLEDQNLISIDLESCKLWNLHGEREVYSIKNVDDAGLLISQDGQYFASQPDGKIIVRNTVTGDILSKFHGRGRLRAFSPTLRYLLVQGSGILEVWNLSSGSLHVRLPTRRFTDVHFSPNEDRMTIFRFMEEPISWNLLVDEPFRHLQDYVQFGSCRVSPSGKFLATGHEDQDDIQIWNLTSGKLHRSIPLGDDHQEKSSDFCFSPLESHIFSWGNEGATLWNIERGLSEWTLTEYVSTAVFSSDGKLLAHVDASTCYVWDATTGELMSKVEFVGYITDMEFSEDQQRLETDLGILDLNPQQGSSFKHILLKENWLTVNRKKLLWLPAPYRPTATALRSGKIVWSYASGEVVLYDTASGAFQNLLPPTDD